MRSGKIFILLATILLHLLMQACSYHDVDSPPPTVITAPVTEITFTSSTSGATVAYLGKPPITIRGVCWSQSPLPTVADFKTEEGAGAGSFVSVLTGLSPATTYYVRAYVITKKGIFYGDVRSFTTNITVTLDVIKDTSIFNNLAGNSVEKDYGAGGSQLLRVGYSASEDAYGRTLVQFDLSSLPSTAIIDSVLLKFSAGKSGTNPPKIYVYRLTQSWTEGTTTEGCVYYGSCQPMGAPVAPDGTDATWINTSNLSNPWNAPGGTFVASPSATSSDLYATVDQFTSSGLMDDVAQWIADPSTNFGWILKVDEPTVLTPGSLKRYVSREAILDPNYPAEKPKLIVVYH